MNRSIALAAFTLAGLFSALSVQAREPATPNEQAQICREITSKEYTRQNHGPAGKSVDVIKVTPRIRVVCNDHAGSKGPARTVALMRHYKSV